MVFPPNATTNHRQISPAIEIVISSIVVFFPAHRLAKFDVELTDPAAKPHRAELGSDENALMRIPFDGTARVKHSHFSR